MHTIAYKKFTETILIYAHRAMFFMLMGALLFASRSGWTEPATRPVSPDTAQSTSMGEILEIAIRQQPDMARATIDREIADAQILTEMGVDDWRFNAVGSFLSTRMPPLNVEYNELKLQADLHRGLASGGTLNLRAETRYLAASLDFPNLAIPNLYQDLLTVTFTQPLLKGRGSKFARAGQKRAQIARNIAELQQQQAAINTVLRVIQAYWEVAYAYRALDITKANLTLAEQLYEDTKSGVESGSMEASELLAVQQTIAIREEDVLSAETAISERSLHLRKVAGMAIGPQDINIVVHAPLDPPERQFPIGELIEEAYRNSVELAALAERKKHASLDLELIENNDLPSLDVSLTFGPLGSSESAGDALINMLTFDDFMIGAQLTLQKDLGGRTVDGRSLQAHAKSRRIDISLDDAKARLAQSLIQTIQQAELAQKRIAVSKRIIELSAKNVEAAQARFELGRSTNYDVLQRQDDMRQAELRQARLISEYLIATAAIDALTGELLSKYGITIDQI